MTNPNLKDAFAAILRRLVAVGVGWFLTWLARRWGIVLDAQTSQAGIMFATVLLASVYGAVVNFLELRIPALGWLLGLARQPKYLKVTPNNAPNRTLDGQPV